MDQREEEGVRYQVRQLPYGGWDAVCEVLHEDGVWRFYRATPGALRSPELAAEDGERMLRDAVCEYRRPPTMTAYERMMARARPNEAGGEIARTPGVDVLAGGLSTAEGGA